MTDIVLNETDRELCKLAARLLMALEPGETREKAADQVMQCYRDDLSEVHSGADPEALEEMTIGFAAALLLEMERLLGGAEVSLKPRGGRVPQRPRVLETLHKYLQMVDPRH